jgi:hypothetical protein
LFTISTAITHSNHNNEELKKLLGVYKLDLVKSKYKKDSLSKFADLTLTVKDNDKFYFSKESPLFPSISGQWNFEDDGDLMITECSFDDTNKHFQILDGIETWTFQSHCLTNGDNGDVIVFSKAYK